MMNKEIDSALSRSGRRGGFSLVEIVIALTIVSVIAAIAIPTLKGLNQSEMARAPVQALAELVQEVRLRAVREGRAYQIVFERGGMHAMAGARPFQRREDLMEHLEELRRPPVITVTERQDADRPGVVREGPAAPGFPTGGAPAVRPATEAPGSGESENTAAPEMPWCETIPLKQQTGCALLLWGDPEWDTMEGDKLRAWVFQPTGMISPARVRLREEGQELEATFDPMTGELTSESQRPVLTAASL
jgi:prepilin-type N-terminal cleavage/methylation domain-containing protein